MKLAEAQARLDRLSSISRVALIVVGYLIALVAASVALVIHVNITSGPDRDASSGMYALADGLLFLLVLAAGALAPTSLLLYCLRRFAALWHVFGLLAVAVAVTGWFAVATIAQAHAELGGWTMLAVPRVLFAPLLLGLYLLVGWFSPSRRNQRWLFAAAGIEGVTTLYGFMHWFVPALFR